MKNIGKFIVTYKLFGLALLALVIGLILQLTPYARYNLWFISAVAIAEVLPLLWGMIQDVRDGTYGIDILAATAIVSAVALKQYWAALVVVLMLTGGEALEDYASQRAKTELDALLKSAPVKAHLLKNNKEIDVLVSSIRAKQKLVIRPGEVVPVDSVILEGTASFDESSLTGESIPQVKSKSQEILSGSINLDGVVTVQALRSAADSQYEQIIKLVKSAAANRSNFVRLADRYSIPFTLISFAIAIGAWVLSGSAIRFVEVLVVATPCPLILAAPIAVISGMSRAAKNGIIVKTGTALEKLAEAKTIGFDKTGTLTTGKPSVKQVITFPSFDQREVLAAAASLEVNSNHVLAEAIVEAAKEKGIKPPKAKKITEISGSGLSAHVSGKDILVGRLSLMQERGVELPQKFNKKEIQDTATYIAINNKLAGIITFEDSVRPEAKKTLAKLRRLGIQHILMVTGDNEASAKAIAKELGLKEVIAEALPADKLKAVAEINERPVAFVGDGVNDAPVLTAADIGIALGARGSTAASESADMVIMLDDVSRVATAKDIADRTFFIAKQSILVGIALSIGLMFIFSTGRFLPVYGAIVQELVDVIVIFNALRAHGSFDTKKAFAKLQSA